MKLEEIEEIERARLVVLQGEDRIARQRQIIAELKLGGYDTGDVESLLRALMGNQRDHKEKLMLLEFNASSQQAA
jgi:hypothetical protein